MALTEMTSFFLCKEKWINPFKNASSPVELFRESSKMDTFEGEKQKNKKQFQHRCLV